MNQSKGTLSATAAGTEQFAARFAGRVDERHFRRTMGLRASSIGIGTYLGDPDEKTDAMYDEAISLAIESGCNVIDTASNYRCQRSERSIGVAIERACRDGGYNRQELIVTTKGGYVPFDGQAPVSRQEMIDYVESTFIKPGICTWDDFVQGSHCMTPGYLNHQIDQSLSNLRLDCVDVYYIHNPESQLTQISRDEFELRLRAAFETLESAVEAGKIGSYGTATWNGYRVPADSPEYLSLERVITAARDVAGEAHHFKVIQLPVNLAMIECFTHQNQVLNAQQATLLEAAEQLEVTVMASASILQSRLSADLPPILAEAFPGLQTDAQRAIQFTRSTPGVKTALIGMRSPDHVVENLALAAHPPALTTDYMKLFSNGA